MKKIKKIATSVGVVGRILNDSSNSQEDTYSCEYINKTLDNQYVLAGIKENKSLEYDATQYKSLEVPLDKIYSKNGNFSLENNKIKIGAGVSKIKISYVVNVHTITTVRDFSISIRKNNVNMNTITPNLSTYGNYSSFTILDVSEDDEISLTILNNWAAANTVKLMGNAEKNMTSVLIEKLY